MIGDRDYMRDPEYRSEMPIYVRLMIILAVIFLLQSFLGVYAKFSFDPWFELSIGGIKKGYVWQLITYQFLHAWPSPWHLIGNCIGLFFLGRSLQDSIGKTNLLQVYFAAGTAGGILQLLVTVLPVYPNDLHVVGASACVYGLLGALATLHPMREISLLVCWLIPITFRLRTLFWIVFALSLYSTFFPSGVVADAAHLGGLLTGVAYIKWFHWGEKPRWLSKIANFFGVSSVRGSVSRPSGAPVRKAKAPAKATEDDPDFISSQVDPILDKISQKGLHSLTDKEREILEKARRNMGR